MVFLRIGTKGRPVSCPGGFLIWIKYKGLEIGLLFDRLPRRFGTNCPACGLQHAVDVQERALPPLQDFQLDA